MKYNNETIIFSNGMRDFLIKKGGILLKTKKNLKDPEKKIYIFQTDSVEKHMSQYTFIKALKKW